MLIRYRLSRRSRYSIVVENRVKTDLQDLGDEKLEIQTDILACMSAVVSFMIAKESNTCVVGQVLLRLSPRLLSIEIPGILVMPRPDSGPASLSLLVLLFYYYYLTFDYVIIMSAEHLIVETDTLYRI